MTYVGNTSDTLNWLNGQLVEIDRWRADMAEVMSDNSMQFIDRLDAHRDWLMGAIDSLSSERATIR